MREFKWLVVLGVNMIFFFFLNVNMIYEHLSWQLPFIVEYSYVRLIHKYELLTSSKLEWKQHSRDF